MNRQQWWKENVLIWGNGWPSTTKETALWEEAVKKGWPEMADEVINHFHKNRYKAMLILQDDLLGF